MVMQDTGKETETKTWMFVAGFKLSLQRPYLMDIKIYKEDQSYGVVLQFYSVVLFADLYFHIQGMIVTIFLRRKKKSI